MTEMIEMSPTAPAHPNVETASADSAGRPQSGRRHLDGSPPGEGSYLTGVTVSLPVSDVAALEQIGNGNRSAAVRLLLETWRQHTERPQRDAEREQPARAQSGRREPAAAGT